MDKESLIGRVHEKWTKIFYPILSLSKYFSVDALLVPLDDRLEMMSDLLIFCQIFVHGELFEGPVHEEFSVVDCFNGLELCPLASTTSTTLSDDKEGIFESSSRGKLKMAETEAPSTFKFSLRSYQKKALTWMIEREREDSKGSGLIHPFWDTFEFPNLAGQFFYRNKFTGELSLQFPEYKSNCLGGILADEMGLGKTIEMLALAHTTFGVAKSTLIVVPMTLIGQWEKEAQRSSKIELSTIFYYGLNRKNFSVNELSNSDLVFTTYGTVSSEFSNSSTSVLFNTHFHRIILDEAHNIKNPSTQAAKACFSLKAKCRWVVTGTPMQNSIDDLFSPLAFLQYEPWKSAAVWKKWISTPFIRKDLQLIETLKTILEPIFLRRTREMKDENGQSVLSLPAREICYVYKEFNSEEKKLYNALHKKSKEEFDSMLDSGLLTLNYMHVFMLIARLRQICDHSYLPSLTGRSAEEKKENSVGEIVSSFLRDHQDKETSSFASQVAAKIKGNMNEISQEECPICFELMEDPGMLGCGHICCYECLIDFIDKNSGDDGLAQCPVCRVATSNSVTRLKVKEPLQIMSLESIPMSTKLEAVLEEISRMKSDEKGVVFSQWTAVLSLLHFQLTKRGICSVILVGSSSQAERQKILKSFEDGDAKILLTSLKTGGVGLNLTMANVVFLCDPWWNFAVENQAIDRVYRIGQQKVVRVYRFIMKESIEEKMLVLQESKKNVIQSVFSFSEEGEESRGAAKIKELQMLFR